MPMGAALSKVTPSNSIMNFGELIREKLPDIDETVLDYVDGYVNDDDSLDEDIPAVVNELLESFARGKEGVLEELLSSLNIHLEQKYKDNPRNNAPKLMRLDRVMDMSKSGMSKTIALAEGVDLESINKSK
jgi:ATP-binding cassette, subfamily F, member 3